MNDVDVEPILTVVFGGLFGWLLVRLPDQFVIAFGFFVLLLVVVLLIGSPS